MNDTETTVREGVNEYKHTSDLLTGEPVRDTSSGKQNIASPQSSNSMDGIKVVTCTKFIAN